MALTGLVFTSCKKSDPVPDTATPNATQLHSFFNNNVTNETQHFTINASTGGYIVGEKGTRIQIGPNSLYNASNQLVSGNVDVELVEVYDRASMVLLNKPTMGQLPDGDLSTLISGGEYYLKITQNGQQVHAPNGVWVALPTQNTGNASNEMSLFDGIIDDEGDLVWNLTEDSVAVVQDSVGGTWTTSYNILDGEWGWTNVDRFYNDPRPKTVLKAKLPDGYDNTNTEVYLAYVGEPSALASLDIFTADGFFSEHYGLIPIGLEVHFIAVTMINGQLNYAIQSTTITNGHIEYINSFTPISQQDLAALINNLP